MCWATLHLYVRNPMAVMLFCHHCTAAAAVVVVVRNVWHLCITYICKIDDFQCSVASSSTRIGHYKRLPYQSTNKCLGFPIFSRNVCALRVHYRTVFCIFYTSVTFWTSKQQRRWLPEQYIGLNQACICLIIALNSAVWLDLHWHGREDHCWARVFTKWV